MINVGVCGWKFIPRDREIVLLLVVNLSQGGCVPHIAELRARNRCEDGFAASCIVYCLTERLVGCSVIVYSSANPDWTPWCG
jgi:hypothetical protein